MQARWMSPRPTRLIKASLAKKGFVEDKTHHCVFWLYVNGTKTRVRTRYSHGATECGEFLLGNMARQLHLSARQFDDLLDCTLDHESLVRLLVGKGVVRE
jgi:hypothetical protein